MHLSSLAQFAHDIYKYEIQRREGVVGRQRERAIIGERLCSSVFRVQPFTHTDVDQSQDVCVCVVFFCKYTLKCVRVCVCMCVCVCVCVCVCLYVYVHV
jgi:hypothetical protein